MYDKSLNSTDINTYQLVLPIAYLLGVNSEKIKLMPQGSEALEKLQKNEKATIIRALCNIRSNLMLKWEETEYSIVYSMKNLGEQELFKDDIKTLNNYGVEFIKVNCKTNQYIIRANHFIKQFIEGIKDIFPQWIEWNYIKNMFIMPNGNSDAAIKKEKIKYTSNMNDYPYQRYVNLRIKSNGNILYNDEKFVKCLYESNNAKFTDSSKLKKAPNKVKNNIYTFVENQKEVIVAVDCENSDAFKIASVFKQLNQDNLKKIKKIVLFDDVNTTSAWRYLQKITGIPVEYVLVERVKRNKSLVDMKICAEVTKERYKNGVQAFILASSDSDYWGLISSLPDTNFLVLIEGEKCGKDIKTALIENDSYFCNLDIFGTSSVAELKINIISNAFEQVLSSLPLYNLKDLLKGCLSDLKISLSEEEWRNIYDILSSKTKVKLRDSGDYYFDLQPFS